MEEVDGFCRAHTANAFNTAVGKKFGQFFDNRRFVVDNQDFIQMVHTVPVPVPVPLSCEGMRCNPATVTLTVAGASQQTYAVRPVRITTTEGLKQNLA